MKDPKKETELPPPLDDEDQPRRRVHLWVTLVVVVVIMVVLVGAYFLNRPTSDVTTPPDPVVTVDPTPQPVPATPDWSGKTIREKQEANRKRIDAVSGKQAENKSRIDVLKQKYSE